MGKTQHTFGRHAGIASGQGIRRRRHGSDSGESASDFGRIGGPLPPEFVVAENPMRRTAFSLYLLFVLAWFTHLSERFAVLGMVRFDLLLLGLLTGLLVMSPNEATDVAAGAVGADASGASRTRKLIIALLVYTILVVPFVQWPGSVLNRGLPNFIKALVFYFFTAKLITTEARLGRLLLVFVVAMTFRVLEPVYLHVTTGYWGSFAYMAGETMARLSGSPFDVINPNGLALVILTVIPFLHYLSSLVRFGRVAYVALLPVLLWALLLTGSRSGLLGLAAVLGMVWLKSRRKVLLTLAVALGVAAALPLLSVDLSDRYLSIVDKHTKNAATAAGRTAGVERDLVVAMRRPFFGHGLGTSQEANANFGGEDQPSHNLYTEAAQEIGFVGLTILVAVIASIASNLRISVRELRATGRASPLLTRLTDAVQVWLTMNILFSFASYGLSSYEWYFAAGLSDVARRFAADIRAGRPGSQQTVPLTAPGYRIGAAPLRSPLAPAVSPSSHGRIQVS
ncbi:MAG: O-antigen ligase family protein [Gammaproteobacteria bacterium]